jgi:hypothetical protein
MKPYRLQLQQAVRPGDKLKQLNFCQLMQDAVEDDNFAPCLVFSDEAIFQLSCKLNHHNLCVWCMENPHATIEHECNSPKVNIFCAISWVKVVGSFFFMENTVTDHSYVDMLQNWLFSHLNEDPGYYIFQLPHWHLDVCHFLNEVLRRCLICRSGPHDLVLYSSK